jgi:hypothetical protein
VSETGLVIGQITHFFGPYNWIANAQMILAEKIDGKQREPFNFVIMSRLTRTAVINAVGLPDETINCGEILLWKYNSERFQRQVSKLKKSLERLVATKGRGE